MEVNTPVKGGVTATGNVGLYSEVRFPLTKGVKER